MTSVVPWNSNRHLDSARSDRTICPRHKIPAGIVASRGHSSPSLAATWSAQRTRAPTISHAARPGAPPKRPPALRSGARVLGFCAPVIAESAAGPRWIADPDLRLHTQRNASGGREGIEAAPSAATSAPTPTSSAV